MGKMSKAELRKIVCGEAQKWVGFRSFGGKDEQHIPMAYRHVDLVS